ncbi:MAG TPA: phosphotransferase [Solirubrobacteraceae bacterium]|nr:phosphotransferase [Solirubrobacteraceae bacterium]
MSTGAVSARAWAQRIDLAQLAQWLSQRRWYASKSHHLHELEIEECALLRDSPPELLTIAQAQLSSGEHDLYQLPLSLIDEGGGDADRAVASAGGLHAVDGLAQGRCGTLLAEAIAAERTLPGEEGTFNFRRADAGGHPAAGPARPVGAEQSHSSLVLGDRTVLKVLRRLEPGVSPELELLRFLSERSFPNVPPLQGFYEYEGRAFTCTLGIAQRFVGGAVGGFELACSWAQSRPEALVTALADLGAVTARLHNCLASDASDPAFTPEEPSAESLSLLTATIDEDIERVFAHLPPDDERLAPIAGRGQDVRERINARGHAVPAGRSIRTHGDYHLGQTLRADGEWQIIDFEGEPSRPLHERRRKRSPLRDVASMLRSFAYVDATARAQGGAVADDWEQRARASFMESYLASIDRTLLPGGEAQILNLLAIFELEKAVYELRYELDHRPEWLPIPVAGIVRLLEAD